MLWTKALHIIFMVTWFAGLFYLPRLFVYHSTSTDQISIDRFKLMERKLYFGIATPGCILTIVFGLWTLFLIGWDNYSSSLWMHIKLGLIIVLLGYYLICGKLLFDFKHNRNKHSHVWYRWFNEIPIVLLIMIVMLAVVKPF